MTPTQRLALVGALESENTGDDAAIPSLAELLDASIHEALLNRIRMTEKRVEKLYELPEIVAMLERFKSRSAY